MDLGWSYRGSEEHTEIFGSVVIHMETVQNLNNKGAIAGPLLSLRWNSRTADVLVVETNICWSGSKEVM